MPLASSIGLRGIKIVTARHFVLRNTYHGSQLVWSNVPYQMTLKKTPSGHFDVLMRAPKNYNIKLERPIIQELRSCFYRLLSVAITTRWQTSSHLTLQQIRFLMRLSGLKFANADYISDVLKNLKSRLSQDKHPSTNDIQKIYRIIVHVLTQYDFTKGMNFINLAKAANANNVKYYMPLIISKLNYLEDMGHLPLDVQSRIQKKRHTDKLAHIPANDYIAVNKNYSWSILSPKNINELINALMFYLK